MKLTSTQATQVVNELIHNSRYPLERSCIELLKVIYPEIIDSKTLGHFEKEGIDAYTYNLELEEYLIAFQFKGFEVMQFGESQKNQCIKSINSFAKTDKEFREYFLISNLPIRNKDLRKEIENEITDKIVPKTKKARLLDVNQFVKLLLELYNKIVFEKIESYNHKVINLYQKTVDQKFYYENIPFKYSLTKSSNNPKTYLFDKSFKGLTKQINYSKWHLIISEFGYGKTSLVQNLISEFKSSGIECIYIPVSSLSSEGLAGTTKISKEIAELIFEMEMDFNNKLSSKLFFSLIKKALTSTKKMILIFDGLDEHNFSYKLTGLKHIFSSLMDVTAPIFITMRKEFWEERQEDIKLTLRKPDKNISIIELTEWFNNNIIEFLELYQKTEAKSEKLEWFKNIVKEKNYKNHFGDIPKRPLFLKMLLKDLKEDNNATNNISTLYHNYFIKKLKIDITGYSGETSRPLNLDGGILTQANNIITILRTISSKMIIVENNEVTLKEFINEKDINYIIESTQVNDILEILMHSVLMPFGSKDINGFRLKFAHKSYQEYFIAMFLYDEIFVKSNSDLNENYSYPKTVSDFLKSILVSKNINYSELKNKSNWEISRALE